MRDLPHRCTVVIEVPRGSFIKRELHGGNRVEFISPVPCPFNYGSVQGIAGPDGDPLDALVLGPRLRVGARVTVRTWAVAAFVDAGIPDPKVVTGTHPPTAEDRLAVERFFRRYARVKHVAARLRGKRGRTAFEGWEAL